MPHLHRRKTEVHLLGQSCTEFSPSRHVLANCKESSTLTCTHYNILNALVHMYEVKSQPSSYIISVDHWHGREKTYSSTVFLPTPSNLIKKTFRRLRSVVGCKKFRDSIWHYPVIHKDYGDFLSNSRSRRDHYCNLEKRCAIPTNNLFPTDVFGKASKLSIAKTFGGQLAGKVCGWRCCS